MFSDRIRVKAIVVSLAFYLIVSVVAMAIVVMIWMPKGVDPARVARLAEVDGSLLCAQNIIGVTLAVAAGALACWLGGRSGLRNSLLIGAALVAYGVLGIYLHPGHPLWMQVSKIIAPIPICLIGGYLVVSRSHLARHPGDAVEGVST